VAVLILVEVIAIPLLRYIGIYATIPFGGQEATDAPRWFVDASEKLWIDSSIVSVVLACLSTVAIVFMYPRNRCLRSVNWHTGC